MAHHLFTWGTGVTVLAPDALRTLLAQELAAAHAHHAAPGQG